MSVENRKALTFGVAIVTTGLAAIAACAVLYRRRKSFGNDEDLPKSFYIKQQIAELIRDPDPNAMDVAQDLALQHGFKLRDMGRSFNLGPLDPADAPVTRVTWNIYPFHGEGKLKFATEIDVWVNGDKIRWKPKVRRFVSRDVATKHAVADAWAVAKMLRKAEWTEGRPEDPYGKINRDIDKILARNNVKATPKLFGADDSQLPLPMDLGPREPTSDELYSVATDILLEFEPYKKAGQENSPEAKEHVRRFKAVIKEIRLKYPDATPPASYTKLYAKLTKPTKTFAQARSDILANLVNHNWAVSPGLQIPHATTPNGKIRLWFKPQAVWYTKVSGSTERHNFRNARTLSYSLDIRKNDPDKFRESIERAST